jgi:hypothetical protein
MRFFVKAIATGFAMSMGSAIFKKVSDKMGLEGEATKEEAKASEADPSADEDAGEDASGPKTP